jgi:L-ascorbate metabolism protein UlaG (beta-lactamase superfamily)
MQIRWHGHSCFEFENKDLTILTDPHDGKSIGIKPPVSKADVVLVSHGHYDHNAVRVVRGEHTDLISEIGEKTIKGIEFKGFPSFHDEESGAIRGTNTIYVFKIDNITVCHCGDLGDFPSDDVIESICGVDILFVPIGEVYTISIPKLMKLIDILCPKIIVPMHYRVGGLTIPLNTIDTFLGNIPEEMIIYVGNEVELSSEDLTEFMGVWVFDR